MGTQTFHPATTHFNSAARYNSGIHYNNVAHHHVIAHHSGVTYHDSVTYPHVVVTHFDDAITFSADTPSAFFWRTWDCYDFTCLFEPPGGNISPQAGLHWSISQQREGAYFTHSSTSRPAPTLPGI
jgi:hypothetical protein